MRLADFSFLKLGWDIKLSGHSYNSREEKSPKTGIASSLPVSVCK